MARKPTSTPTTFASLLNMTPESAKEVIKKLTPAKLTKLKADIHSRLNQTQYLDRLVNSVIKDSSPDYYAAMNTNTSNANNFNHASINNNLLPAAHPLQQVPIGLDPGRGFDFNADLPPVEVFSHNETYDLLEQNSN